jgi:hypothetical protein
MIVLVVLAVATTVTVNLQILSLVAGIAVPFLTRLVTTKLAPGWLQVLILTLLATVGGVVASLINSGGTFVLQPTLLALLVTWVTAFAAHYGFETAGTLPALGRATARFGLGPRPPKALGGPAGVAEQVVRVAAGHIAGPPDAIARIRVIPD